MMTPYSIDRNVIGKGSRVDWVDFAKGFCIFFVVMMHATLGVEKYAAERGVSMLGDTGFMNYIVTFAAPFRMPDFFMISGLFLGLVITRAWLRYIDRKVVHFAYFYVLWLIVQFAFKSIGWVAEGTPVSEIGTTFAFALIEPYGTLWFIYMLPVMFLVTRVLRHIPWYLVLGFAALLEIAPIHTGYLLVDEFASRYVYFFAGYALAKPIFSFADWARENVGKASAALGVWLLVNAVFTFSAVPDFIANIIERYGREVPESLAQLPFVSLFLGTLGALAIIAFSSVISKFSIAKFLRYLGQNSIAVYLAFFLPMIITREILLRFTPWMDLGSMSVIVLTVSMIGPVIALEFTRITGWFGFMFVRPEWAKIDRSEQAQKADKALQPAE